MEVLTVNRVRRDERVPRSGKVSTVLKRSVARSDRRPVRLPGLTGEVLLQKAQSLARPSNRPIVKDARMYKDGLLPGNAEGNVNNRIQGSTFR